MTTRTPGPTDPPRGRRPPPTGRPRDLGPPPTPTPTPTPTPVVQEIVHRLPHDPVHLWQLSTDPGTYSNPLGCGAFSTSMGLSCYDATRFGNYDSARNIFDAMFKVPFFGGTFESQNA